MNVLASELKDKKNIYHFRCWKTLPLSSPVRYGRIHSGFISRGLSPLDPLQPGSPVPTTTLVLFSIWYTLYTGFLQSEALWWLLISWSGWGTSPQGGDVFLHTSSPSIHIEFLCAHAGWTSTLMFNNTDQGLIPVSFLSKNWVNVN